MNLRRQARTVSAGRRSSSAAVAQGRGVQSTNRPRPNGLGAGLDDRLPRRRQRSVERWLRLDRRDGRLRWQRVRRDDERAVEQEGQPPAPTVIGGVAGGKGG
jgi:hypothetical protein